MQSSVMEIDILPGMNEATSTILRQRPCLTGLSAVKVGNPESVLNDQHITSIQFRDAEKVFIPDMFVSFVSQKVKPNQHYEVLKLESEMWMAQSVEDSPNTDPRLFTNHVYVK